MARVGSRQRAAAAAAAVVVAAAAAECQAVRGRRWRGRRRPEGSRVISFLGGVRIYLAAPGGPKDRCFGCVVWRDACMQFGCEVNFAVPLE